MKSDSANKLVKITSVVEKIFGDDLHKKRQQSLAYAAMGVLGSESLFLHRIAEGLADTRGTNKKHATKQVDRLLSNKGISIWDLSEQWVKYVVGANQSIIVALDWSSFFDDEQSMLSLNKVGCQSNGTCRYWNGNEDLW